MSIFNRLHFLIVFKVATWQGSSQPQQKNGLIAFYSKVESIIFNVLYMIIIFQPKRKRDIPV